MFPGNKGTNSGKGFSERRKVEINAVLGILFFSCTCAGLAHDPDTVCVINEQSEIKLFF